VASGRVPEQGKEQRNLVRGREEAREVDTARKEREE
jgi:hypothetical protein